MLRVRLQTVVQQGVETAEVELGMLVKQAQAKLDGFKSRALRSQSPIQRHLYTTEWH